jgi:hypothetical protein
MLANLPCQVAELSVTVGMLLAFTNLRVALQV